MISFCFQSCFIFALLFFFSTLFLFAFLFKKPKNDLPPSPPSLPVIGYLHLIFFFFFGENFHQKIFTLESYEKLFTQDFRQKVFTKDFLLLFASIHKTFQKITSTYGPFLQLRILNLRIVLVSSASVIVALLRSMSAWCLDHLASSELLMEITGSS